MKVLTSWLREFANPNVGNKELAETLTMTGLEVDSITTIAPEFSGVVVGEIKTCKKHPNADKLNLCQVNIGTEILQIICGAKNVCVGLKVCVAMSGATLPGNFKIKKVKLRSVESNGMICSASEIGLATKSDGIMELSANLQIGDDIRKALNLDDEIIELDITPNRGDCSSILGVAREVCANYNINLNFNHSKVKSCIDNNLKVSVINPKHCPKYLTRIIDGIDNTKKTPEWMANILTRSGQSLHSPVVDITNFVLLETGQPMHAFDASNIDELNIRLSNSGEKITLLNEQEVELNAETLIIANSKKPLAIAGIMGGFDNSTTEKSTAIILEAAFFDNVLMTGVARNYCLHTESSLRFERGMDYNLPEIAMERATALILKICGGNASNVVSKISEKDLPKQAEITIKYSKITKILGFTMDKKWILEKFQQLNFEITNNNDTEITIKAPSYRFDINIEADLIEELARLYGYNKLPTAKLSLESNLQNNNNFSKYDLKNILVAKNYNEVITYSFISEKMFEITNIYSNNKTQLINPISKDMAIMRTSIIAGLLKTAIDNINRGQNNLRIFETGLCFNGLESSQQLEKIAGLISGNNSYFNNENQEFDFFDLKADVLSIIGDKNIEFIVCENKLLQKGQAASIIINGKKCGYIGALSPKIVQELSLNKCFIFEIDLVQLLVKNTIKYQQFSIYQSSSRDISMLFNKKISYNEIVNSIKSLKEKNLKEIELVDIWSGKGIDSEKHSLTISLSFQANDTTLTDEEIDNPVKKIVKLLTKEYNAEQR